MTTIAVTSANVGTKLATSTDAHITGITVNQPSANADILTPLTLVDAAVAPSAPKASLFLASISDLSFIFKWKPNITPPTGMVTPPAFPMSLGNNMGTSFLNGLFVVSCPANVTFNVTTGP